MKVYAIADLHLSFAVKKPMDIFGQRWKQHEEKIRDNWDHLVSGEDTVIIPGDISWATTLDEILPDLKFINDLPGHKLLLRGNHDYWWQSMSKLTQLCRHEELSSLDFIQNDARLLANGAVVCGSRGWILPGDTDYCPETDEKIVKRELIRLRLSLEAAAKIHQDNHPLIVALHYPPFLETERESDFTLLMAEYEVTDCVFGHIHHPWSRLRLDKERISNINYSLVASDLINFTPKLIVDH